MSRRAAILSTLLTIALLLSGCTATPPGGLASASDEFRVGLLLPGVRNDGNWGQAMFGPVNRIGQDVHGDAFRLSVVTGQFGEANRRTIERWVSQKYDVIIDHGTARDVALDEAASAPEVTFAVFGGPAVKPQSQSPVENVWSYSIDSGDVALVRSALTAAIAGDGSIGLLRPFAGDEFDDDFTAGAQAAGSSSTVDIRELRSFSDTRTAVLRAEELVQDGAGVLTGTSEAMLGAIVVAQRERVPWVGTRVDQSYLAPDVVFASQLVRFELLVPRLLDASSDNGAGHMEFGVENGGIDAVFNDDFALEGGDEARTIARRAMQRITGGQRSGESE